MEVMTTTSRTGIQMRNVRKTRDVSGCSSLAYFGAFAERQCTPWSYPITVDTAGQELALSWVLIELFAGISPIMTAVQHVALKDEKPLLHIAVETNPSARAIIRTNHTDASVWKRVGWGENEFNPAIAMTIL